LDALSQFVRDRLEVACVLVKVAQHHCPFESRHHRVCKRTGVLLGEFILLHPLGDDPLEDANQPIHRLARRCAKFRVGVIALDREAKDEAKSYFNRSLEKRPTYLALRHLALVAGTPDEAERLYLRAWDTGQAPTQLAVEIVTWMQQNDRLGALAAFLKRLPPKTAGLERIRLARAQAAISSGDLDLAENLLNYHFATIREGDLILTELWEKLQTAKAERKLGRPPTPAEIKAALAAAPLPIYLDFGV